MIEITESTIDEQRVIESAKSSACGAVVTFLGIVRDNSEGKHVLYLEYDVYPEMAKKKLKEIASDIQSRWGSENVSIVHRVGPMEIGEIASDIQSGWGSVNVSIVHRVGKMEIGETAVVIAVGSAHRLAAFQACQYAIDRIKEIVPIWKKEFYEDGSEWIGHK